jgi:hypothetical protein
MNYYSAHNHVQRIAATPPILSFTGELQLINVGEDAGDNIYPTLLRYVNPV